MTIQYDLHSHSTASDGILTPSDLLRHAFKQKVAVLALTDHDNTAGLQEAFAAANNLSLKLIAGIEISVTWGRQTVHILGLDIDVNNTELQAGLTRLMAFRDWRAEEIARRLAKAGIAGAYEGARRFKSGRIFSRTHFARFLVEAGHARSVREVFKKFLVNNKPGYVAGEWASLQQCLAWIHAAGGIAIIAHPARYPMTNTKLRRLIVEFKDNGGDAIEVVSGSHSNDENRYIGELCQHYNLYASCGSDYHGAENAYIELGRIPALPDKCQPVWTHPNWPNDAK